MIRCAITDRTLYPGDESARRAALVQQAFELARAGVNFLQLREKDLAPAALVALARELMDALKAGAEPSAITPKLLINSRLDVALAARADGIHLTSRPNELRPSQIRELYQRAGLNQPIISVSCHTLAEVERVTQSDTNSLPDLILFGPVFEKVVRTRSAPGNGVTPAHDLEGPPPPGTRVAQGTGLDLLHQSCTAAVAVPVLALGGVTTENAAACTAAGAAGIAGIRLYHPHPRAATV